MNSILNYEARKCLKPNRNLTSDVYTYIAQLGPKPLVDLEQ
jgi:hypothetical protein